MAAARFGVNETECNGFPVGEYGSKTHAKPLCTVQGVAVLSSRLIQSNQPRTAHRERINRESSVDAPLCRSTPKRAWPSDAGTGMSPLLYWFLWLSSRLRVSPQTLAKRGCYWPSSISSSPVLAPCLRRRSAVLGWLYLMAQSKGVLPESSILLTPALFAIRSSIIPLFGLLITASCNGVAPLLSPSLALTSEPFVRRNSVFSFSPNQTA